MIIQRCPPSCMRSKRTSSLSSSPLVSMHHKNIYKTTKHRCQHLFHPLHHLWAHSVPRGCDCSRHALPYFYCPSPAFSLIHNIHGKKIQASSALVPVLFLIFNNFRLFYFIVGTLYYVDKSSRFHLLPHHCKDTCYNETSDFLTMIQESDSPIIGNANPPPQNLIRTKPLQASYHACSSEAWRNLTQKLNHSNSPNSPLPSTCLLVLSNILDFVLRSTMSTVCSWPNWITSLHGLSFKNLIKHVWSISQDLRTRRSLPYQPNSN